MDILRVRRLPFMARRNYFIEVRHLLFWGVLAGLVEGTVSAVIVSKTFGASNLLITIVQATPAFANLVSLVWGAMLVGRRKLPVLLSLGAACIAVTLSVAATPHTTAGGWIFALQIALSRVFMAGVVTTRASLWKSNYPRSHRGRITANLQIVRTLTSIPLILGCGWLFDTDPGAYRWFYPVVSAIGAVALLLLRQTRVRGERAAMARRGAESVDEPDEIAEDGLLAPFSASSLLSPAAMIERTRAVLSADHRFARYCAAQMCIGSANLLVTPVNTILLTKVLHLTYTASNTLLDIIPRIITLLMLPVWARLFDRVGVLRFRVINSACWSGSMLLCGTGAALATWSASHIVALQAWALIVFGIGRVIDGMAQGGGAIAWNIGHLHFAEDDKADLYMGVHVSLTGLRGLIMPFIGVLLYTWIDWGVFVIAFGTALLGMHLFRRLALEDGSGLEAEVVEDHAGARDRAVHSADLVRR